jgi:sporulation protein YlmC with PRC-barrel domain
MEDSVDQLADAGVQSRKGGMMLRNIKNLRGYTIRAIDGTIGKVDDFYFDDEDWGIRYLIVDTGSWLSGRKVLISPVAVGHAGWMARRLPVALTSAQVEHSPDIDTRKPVSRQHEAQYLGYYGYPTYWGGAGLWGVGAYPGGLTAQGRVEQDLKDHGSLATPDDCHLRSSSAVIGHHIRATDGDIGHLDDLLVDDYTWAIRYLVVNTSNWWGGQRVLVSPEWIRDVSWPEASVSVHLTRQAIKDAPLFGSAAALDRQLEEAIYEHYARPGYWTTSTPRRPPQNEVCHAGPEVHRRRQV